MKANPNLPDSVKQQVVAASETSANFVSTDQVEQAAKDAGLPPRQTTELVAVYSDSQLKALRAALGFLALFALLTLVWVDAYPNHARSAPDDDDEHQKHPPDTAGAPAQAPAQVLGTDDLAGGAAATGA